MAAASSSSSSVPPVFGKMDSDMALRFLDFVNASPSQFHAVATTAAQLDAAGFKQVSERQPEWNVKPGGKYYYTRNQSSIVAFAVGEQWKSGNGFTITAAHTDSPVLKIKPVSKVARNGYLQVGCECYGGGLWHTWSVKYTQKHASPCSSGLGCCSLPPSAPWFSFSSVLLFILFFSV
jgi:aspartyl aminopeptidase